MKNSRKVAAGLCLLLIAVVIFGQENKVAVGSKRRFKHTAEIASVYDKAKNQTTVVMDWYEVYSGLLDPSHVNSYQDLALDRQDNRVFILAAFTIPGRVLSLTPEDVEFGIKIGNRGGAPFKKAETPELIAVVDGQTISLGKTSLLKLRTWVTTENSRQVSFAQLSARFTYQGLQRIVQAKQVAMKIGQIQFELKETNLEALRDLASKMVP